MELVFKTVSQQEDKHQSLDHEITNGKMANTTPIDETNLAGEQALSAKFDPSRSGLKRTDLWELPHTFAAPDHHTVLIAGSDTVWRVEMDTQQWTRFALPEDHFLKWNFEHDGIISPDGAAFGFLFGQYRLAFPYVVDNYVCEGNDIVVFAGQPAAAAWGRKAQWREIHKRAVE
jgi:hypothetical protein